MGGSPRDYVLLLPSLRSFGFSRQVRLRALHHLLGRTGEMTAQDMAQTASELARARIPQAAEALTSLGKALAARLDDSLRSKPRVLATYLRACSLMGSSPHPDVVGAADAWFVSGSEKCRRETPRHSQRPCRLRWGRACGQLRRRWLLRSSSSGLFRWTPPWLSRSRAPAGTDARR